MGEVVQITVDDLKAVIVKTVEETIRKQRGQTMSISEYARDHRISRTTVYAMIARKELELDKHNKIKL